MLPIENPTSNLPPSSQQGGRSQATTTTTLPPLLTPSSTGTLAVIPSPPQTIRETFIQRAANFRPLLFLVSAIGLGGGLLLASERSRDGMALGVPLCLAALGLGFASFRIQTAEEDWKEEAGDLIETLAENNSSQEEIVKALLTFIDEAVTGKGAVKRDFDAVVHLLRAKIGEQLQENDDAPQTDRLHLMVTCLNTMESQEKVRAAKENQWKEEAVNVLNNLSEREDLDVEQAMHVLRKFTFDTLGSEHDFILPIQSGLDYLHKQVQVLSEKKGGAKENFLIIQNCLKGSLFTSQELKRGKYVEDSPSLSQAVHVLISESKKEIEPREDVGQLVQIVQQERLWCLHNLEFVYLNVIQDPSQCTISKVFPPVTTWFIGSRGDGKIPFEMDLANIGQKHGIYVVSDSQNEEFRNCDNTLIFNFKPAKEVSTFAQDYLDSNGRELRCLSFNRPGLVLNDVLLKARRARFDGYNDKTDQNLELINRLTIGLNYETDCPLRVLALASSLGVPPCMSLTYSEGGNTLIGSSGGKTYMIVGKDSFDFSRALMEKDLGRSVSDKEIYMAFGIDYGLAMEQISCIEQPGDFHLDMNIAILSEKTVVVNDALMAFDMLESHLADTVPIPDKLPQEQKKGFMTSTAKKMLSMAKTKKKFEDQAAKELKSQGFTVIRFPGRFDLHPSGEFSVPITNFFNMISCTTPEGKRLVVALGSPDEGFGFNMKEHFKKMLEKGGVQYDELIFLNYENSQLSLRTNGGISCRTKPIGIGK